MTAYTPSNMSRTDGWPPACRVPWLSASFCARDHGVEDFGLRLLVARLRPCAPPDQMVLEPDDGIAERPSVGLGLGPIGGRIVGGRVRADAVGYIFDQGRAEIAVRALDRPFRDGMNGEIVVAVDP